MAKADQSNAERAAEWWAREQGCVLTRRALRTKFAKVDFFASDIMGKRADGSMVFIQVTAAVGSGNVTARRRKLEAVPWAQTDSVFLLHFRREPDPANRRKLKYYFRVHEYGNAGWLVWDEAVDVPQEWFKPVKEVA